MMARNTFGFWFYCISAWHLLGLSCVMAGVEEAPWFFKPGQAQPIDLLDQPDAIPFWPGSIKVICETEAQGVRCDAKTP
ncbi:uncharacterized protein BDZ83DRAFT_32532 [Colletotrichum acutatum]|uniref:Uncharacterized protein n=1 Tax=Glomerella acutata TaxID=27357 RepID=A0AAD8XLD4_GLOAC|nr:uncharacterized protein BDZ83DRAFT_32532 [Colletotrichum acutatum]KAK1729453.1 hypothetical protein BDZ83DRAFT_32532 [Colletotrichum acutatum]